MIRTHNQNGESLIKAVDKTGTPWWLIYFNTALTCVYAVGALIPIWFMSDQKHLHWKITKVTSDFNTFEFQEWTYVRPKWFLETGCAIAAVAHGMMVLFGSGIYLTELYQGYNTFRRTMMVLLLPVMNLLTGNLARLDGDVRNLLAVVILSALAAWMLSNAEVLKAAEPQKTNETCCNAMSCLQRWMPCEGCSSQENNPYHYPCCVFDSQNGTSWAWAAKFVLVCSWSFITISFVITASVMPNYYMPLFITQFTLQILYVLACVMSVRRTGYWASALWSEVFHSCWWLAMVATWWGLTARLLTDMADSP